MTEAEWAACTNPTAALTFLRGQASDRKMRLFAVACCRKLWEFIRDERLRKATDVAEQFADAGVTASELRAADESTAGLLTDPVRSDELTPGELSACWVASESAAEAAEYVLGHCSRKDFDVPYKILLWWRQKRKMATFQLCVFRDLFGLLPFRAVAFDPSWRTSDVMLLATGIYEEKAFDRMPILADALQDAGCDNEQMLLHCRDTSLTHVRGCWALDLVLGKE
jgi:hypothetical protein